MTERVLGEKGSTRRKRFLLLPVLATAALALFWVAGAQAVHDETFQLDGNVDPSDITNIDGQSQTVDWASLFGTDGSTVDPLPTGFEDANLERDFNTSAAGAFLTNDGTTFSTGSKDTLPISGWQCNLDNNVNSKIDVMNGYAATYTAANDDEILYFGIERNVNTGDANVGFWFLQDEVSCLSTGPSVTFSGEHMDGDLLVVSEFSNGGLVSTINVYRWDRFTGDCLADPPGANCVINPTGVPGFLRTTPVASGVDCRSETTDPDDSACGAANTEDLTNIPWLTAAKTTVGHTLPEAQFFEGGVNLTAENLGGRCFNTFLADTRSSTSLTATLFDFVGGQLGDCEAGMTTSASATGTTVAPGTSVTDTATITVTGADNPDDPTGDVTFFLCTVVAPATDCSTGGTNIGTGTLDGGADLFDGVATATSPAVNTPASVTGNLSPGRYCFRAEWPGDDNYGGTSHTDSTTECFNVGDTSSVSTEQDWLPNDTATITTGTGTGNISGDVTFELFESDDCTGTAVFTETDNNVTGASGTTTSTANTDVYTDNVTVSWKVTFTSDDPNVSNADPVCETSAISGYDNDVPIGP